MTYRTNHITEDFAGISLQTALVEILHTEPLFWQGNSNTASLFLDKSATPSLSLYQCTGSGV